MSKHTPGPWGCYPKIPTHLNLPAVAVYVVHGHNPDGESCYPTHYEEHANAQLIAAAPELLQAAQNARSVLWPDYENEKSEKREGPATRAWKELDKAIAKTEGEK